MRKSVGDYIAELKIKIVAMDARIVELLHANNAEIERRRAAQDDAERNRFAALAAVEGWKEAMKQLKEHARELDALKERYAELPRNDH